jgi:hypothetical protein
MQVTEWLQTPEYTEHYFDTMADMRPMYKMMKQYIAYNVGAAVLKVFKFLQARKTVVLSHLQI